MTQMIRKQIYLQKRQQVLLQRLSKARGISESELIRQAVDTQLAGTNAAAPADIEAWELAHRLMQSLYDSGPVPDRRRDWTRDDIYEERLSRYARHTD